MVCLNCSDKTAFMLALFVPCDLSKSHASRPSLLVKTAPETFPTSTDSNPVDTRLFPSVAVAVVTFCSVLGSAAAFVLVPPSISVAVNAAAVQNEIIRFSFLILYSLLSFCCHMRCIRDLSLSIQTLLCFQCLCHFEFLCRFLQRQDYLSLPT